MYTEEIEQYLANAVEDPAKSAIEKIRDRKPLTEDDRRALANYVIALWKRVPEGRTRIAERMPKVAAEVRSNLHGELSAAVTADPRLAALAQSQKEQVNRIIAAYESAPTPNIWQQSLGKESSARVIDSLLSMEWRFLYSDREQFITCDNPVFFFPHEGIGKPTSEL
ncbi:MAG: hypothetical protein RL571_3066 [Pseudomonadota bacterium]